VLEHFEQPDGLGPVNGYSHAVAAPGGLIAVSGQLPVDRKGTIVDTSDALVQARQVFTNLDRALRAAGAGPQDVLRLTVFLTDLEDLDAFRTARDEFIDGAPPPASSLVRVAGLAHPEARIEVDALAMIDVTAGLA